MAATTTTGVHSGIRAGDPQEPQATTVTVGGVLVRLDAGGLVERLKFDGPVVPTRPSVADLTALAARVTAAVRCAQQQHLDQVTAALPDLRALAGIDLAAMGRIVEQTAATLEHRLDSLSTSVDALAPMGSHRG